MITDPAFVADLRVRAAMEFLKADEIDKGLIEIEDLLDKQPNHTEAIFIASQAYLLLGNSQSALEALQVCVLQAPQEPEIHLGMAIAAFETSNFQLCLSAAEFAISLQTDCALAWRYKGLSLERLEQPKKAEIAFLRAFELEPDANPMPMVLDELQIEKSVLNAITELPLHIQDFYNSIERTIVLFPPVELLEKVKPSLSPLINVYLDSEKNLLYIFSGNLKYLFHKDGSLKMRLKATLIEEAEMFHEDSLSTE